MKKIKRLQMLGICLILCGLLALLAGYLLEQKAQTENRQAVAQMQSILPPAAPGIADQYSHMEMPSLQIGGRDYVALLEAPMYGVRLPVRSRWSALEARSCPCRFYGTVYDGSLIIGGNQNKDQFAFLTQIQNGDKVVITDMTGAQFAYRVSLVYRTDSVDAQSLMDDESDLTLFAPCNFGLEYVVVRFVADVVTQ